MIILFPTQNALSEKLDIAKTELVSTQNENASLRDQLDRFRRELQLAKQVERIDTICIKRTF